MAIHEPAPAVDAVAFGRLFDEWLDPIYGFVARRVDDREAVEEVTARTFQRALDVLLQGGVTFEGLPGFLLRVASSAVVDHARRLRREIPAGVRASDLDEDGDAEAAAWLADAVAARMFAAAVDGIALRRATLRLDDEDLRTVLLGYLDGLDRHGIAAVLGCSSEGATVRLHRALNALVAELSRSEVDVA